jgi:3'-phosphoadenosine 5'-phosphosulfate sulfotransferase (PAPS reductase)/FAD synthetase
VRKIFNLPPIHYCFFNTGLEMEAIKRHVQETAELYGVTITEHRPKKNIVQATREHGQPFVSKIMSSGLEGVQKKNIPLSIAAEYVDAEDKAAKRAELKKRYPKCESTINFLCGCNSGGEPRPDIQLVIGSSKYMLDFIIENPIPFKVSNKCCDYCKKQVAHNVQKSFDMIITGERRDEGGMRSVPRKDNTSMCFTETADGKYRLRPLYYVSNADKQWYKNYYKIRYSDAYEVYGLTRTGCCGCSISAKATEDLEKIRPFEPNLVKAAWNVFGDSYRYRQKYNEYKAIRRKGQSLFPIGNIHDNPDLLEVQPMIIADKPISIDMGHIEGWTITSLRKACAKNHIKGYTKMNKSQLVDEIKNIFAKLAKETL